MFSMVDPRTLLLMGGALFTPSEGPHVTKPLRHLHEVALNLYLTCTVYTFAPSIYYHNTYILIHIIIYG